MTENGESTVIWYLLPIAIVAALAIAFYRIGAGQPVRAREQFGKQRSQLQEDFLAAARASGKPRGLRWKALDWTGSETQPQPALARDRESGEVVALLPVTIQFEAIAGSDMEGLPAVGNLRNASAVFFYRRGRWQTSGKAVFNLNPDEAIAHFKDQYSPLEPPAAPREADTR